MKYYQEYTSPIGQIRLMEEDHAIVRLELAGTPGSNHFLRRGEPTYEEWGRKWIADGAECLETPVIRQAHRELEEYFAGKRRKFSVPLSAKGTPFQEKVWEVLQTIPYGETRTYGQVAAALGKPSACRAVGMANHCNPVSIMIPCHRVIGAKGALTGYGGGLDLKEFLLRLEQNHTERIGVTDPRQG